MADIDFSEVSPGRRYDLGKLDAAITMLITGEPGVYHNGMNHDDICNRVVWFYDEFHVHVDSLKQTLNAYLEQELESLFFELRNFKQQCGESNLDADSQGGLTRRAISLAQEAFSLCIRIHRLDATNPAR